MNIFILLLPPVLMGIVMHKVTGKNGYQWYGIALLVSGLFYLIVSALVMTNQVIHDLVLEEYYSRSVISTVLMILTFAVIIWRRRM